jgi:exosortase
MHRSSDLERGSGGVLVADSSSASGWHRWMGLDWPQLLGVAALLLPTLGTLARKSWSTESGAHGPIVLATGLWLIWRERAVLAEGKAQPLLPALPVLLPAFLAYGVGRITGVLAIECLALYVVLLTLGWLAYGGAVLRRLWFPCVYMLFLIVPPQNWLFVATRPIKLAIAESAVDLLSALGFDIGSTGVTIQIDNYELLIATACSGVNSLIGIAALGLFYVYLIHGSRPVYALVLTTLLLPIAILTNFLRIVLLVLITRSFGEAAGQGLAHDAAGLAMFMLAMGLLIAIDALLHPLVGRVRPAVRGQRVD